MNEQSENMTDKELEVKVYQLGNEIMELCDEMEQKGLDDDIAIAEAGLEQAIKDIEDACTEFDKKMEQIEKEFARCTFVQKPAVRIAADAARLRVLSRVPI